MKKIISLLLISLFAFSLTGCSKEVDYVSKLSLDESMYQGKSFLTDGIGEVSLYTSIDGDTAHFTQSGTSVIIKVRFLGVDTPESTGLIEEWGKAASTFTEEALTNATTIVLESNGSAPEVDGNGRHLAWVWVDGKLLNLMLIQEGLAKVSNVDGSDYNSVLYDADLQSQKLKLKIWSDDEDPDFFYGDAEEVSLDYLRKNIALYSGRRVIFEGVVSRQDELGCYIQMEDEEGISYAIYVFASYQQTVFNALSVSNKVKINGIVSFYEGTGSYQIVDVKYNQYLPSDYDIEIIQTGYHRYAPNEIVTTEMDVRTNTAIEHTYVKLSNLTATGGYNEYSDDERTQVKAITVYCVDEDGNEVNLRISSAVPISKFGSYTFFINKSVEATFNCAGVVTLYGGNYQLTIVSESDMSYN